MFAVAVIDFSPLPLTGASLVIRDVHASPVLQIHTSVLNIFDNRLPAVTDIGRAFLSEYKVCQLEVQGFLPKGRRVSLITAYCFYCQTY